MTRKILPLVLIGVLIFACGVWASRALFATETGGGQPVYATALVERGTIEVTVEGFGPVQPIYQSDIQAFTEGVVEEVFVDRGQMVTEGDIVARLRNDKLMVEIAQLSSQLEKARLELSAVLGVTPDRVTTVDANRGINVTAPCSGRIQDLQVAITDEVSEGTLLARIVDDSQIIILAEVNEHTFKNLREGQELNMQVEGFHGFITGKITELDPTPVPRSHSFLYRATIVAENTGLLKPGQVVRIEVPLDGEAFTLVSKIDRYRDEEVVRSPAEGTVTELPVKGWSVVEQGDVIAVLGGSTAQRYIKGRQLDIQDLEVELAQKQEELENLTIRSPITGVVAWIWANRGQQLRSGETLAMVMDQSKMSLNIQADELDVVYIREGQEARITVDAVPGQQFPARVERVDMMGQTNDGIATYNVNLLVEDTEVLRPGMTANVYIFVDSKEDVLLVPVEAIFDQDGQAMVEVIAANGRPEARPIEIGLINSRVAEVVSGLEEGEQVVTGSTFDRLEERADEGRGGNPLPGGPVMEKRI